MIAIAILGIGLLMVASMFPIAWSKARDLSHHTTAVSCAEMAGMTVELVTRVDGFGECENYTSFAGDYVVEASEDKSKSALPPPDNKVHPLTVENILAIAKSDGSSPIITEETWRLTDGDADDYQMDDSSIRVEFGDDCGLKAWYNEPQVMFDQRVYPSVEPYPADVTAPDPQIDEWYTRLDTRRFCWSVFHSHRLNKEAISLLAAPNPAHVRQAARMPREFTMYYVTLQRARGQRFVRQDEVRLASDEIKAMEDKSNARTDVRFPSPWLVPLLTPDATHDVASDRRLNFRYPSRWKGDVSDAKDVVPRGVPTEVLVEAVEGTDDDFREFFAPGAWFIDHLNGEVYRVVKRRFNDDKNEFVDDRFDDNDDNSANLEAILTLDREIFVDDLCVDGSGMGAPCDPAAGWLPVVDRRVWVFPPAVERIDEDEWVAEGPPPVVAIDVRSVVIHPQ